MKFRNPIPLPSDTPTAFLQTHTQIAAIHGPQGVTVRNELIRDELSGLASARNSEHRVEREKGFVVHHLPDVGITVRLCDS